MGIGKKGDESAVASSQNNFSYELEARGGHSKIFNGKWGFENFMEDVLIMVQLEIFLYRIRISLLEVHM